MKRWTLLAITITVLVMSLMILPMNAETTPVSKGLAYSVNPDGTTCTITGIGTCTDRNIYIPYKVDGYKVTHIGDFAFWACSSLTSVNIPDGVTSIGYNAFGGCDKLISVTMGNGVKKIGEWAFWGCSSLTNIEIPDSVTSIGKCAFSECGLRSIDIPDSVISIGDNAFLKCLSLKRAIIGKGVDSIGYDAFRDCRSLVNVKFLNKNTVIYGNRNTIIYDSNNPIYGGATIYGYEGSTAQAYAQKYGRNFVAIYCEGNHCAGGTVVENRINATCTVDGSYDNVVYCTVCKKELSRDTIHVSAPGYHTEDEPVARNIVKETCTVDGRYDSVIYCVACRKELSRETITIPAVGHIAAKPVEENKINVTTTTDGSYDIVTYCSGCGIELSRESILIPATFASAGLAYFVNPDGSTCKVTGIGTCTDTELYIPTEIDGYTVTGIDKRAFDGCGAITTVHIPDSITSIGDWAFLNCNSLTGVYISDIAKWCGIEFDDDSSNPLYYAKKLYLNGELITDLVIPEGVTSIRDYAFYSCRNLTSVTIGNGVASIGEYAFYGCDNLTSVTISNGVTSIESYAFCGCNSLANIDIPDTVTSIGDGAFYSCFKLTSIDIPDGITRIGEDTFRWCNSLTSIDIPNSVTSIGEYAFYDCDRLTSVTVGNGVTSVGNYAFEYCYNLTGVYISDITKWCRIEFSNWYSNPLCYAEKLYLDGELVTDLVIPEDVANIGTNVFYNCSSLASIKFLNKYTVIPSSGSIPSSAVIYGYEGSIAQEYAARYNREFVLLEGGESVFEPESSGFEYSISGGCATITGIGTCSDTEVKIPKVIDGLFVTTVIGKRAFENCNKLVSIAIPDSVTTIGFDAFYCCSRLTSVIIPDSVTAIGDSAFYNCRSLTSVYISDIAKWCDILFVNAASNPLYYAKNLYLNGELVTQLMIPEGVTSIGDYTFCNCSSLTSVNIPDSVTSIGSYTFYGCSSLTSIKLHNKDTEIYDSKNTISSTATIYGYEGSTAQAYAQKYGRTFVPIYCEGTHYAGDTVVENNLKATCTADGSYDNVIYCTACRKELSRETITIPAVGSHIEGDPIEENRINATITTDGSYDIVIYCSECRIELARETVLIPATFVSVGLVYSINPDGLTCNITGIGTCTDTELYIPAELNGYTVTGIDKEAFDGCGAITTVHIPASVTSIGMYAFEFCRSLSSIDIPDGVTSIESYAFRFCSSLTSINIPSSVTSIGNDAFSGCSSLTSINIPSSVTSIGNYTFYKCSSLTSIEIPDGVTSIGSSTFDGCSSLTSIDIPDSVTRIGFYAFSGCDRLASIKFLNKDTVIYNSSSTIPQTTTIYGYGGSTAQAYAEKYDRTFVAIEEPAGVLGDVNGDTIVNSDDAVAILRYLAGYEVDGNIALGDYNSDGVTNSDDAVAILRMLAGYVD